MWRLRWVPGAGWDHAFRDSVTEKLLSYLKSICEHGNRQSRPHSLAPIVGIQSGAGPTDVDYQKDPNALCLEACWTMKSVSTNPGPR